jgi:hypothetical protein
MTRYKQYSKNTTWQHRIRRGGLYVAAAAVIAAHTNCGNSSNGSDWEEVTTYEVTKGVITTVEETEPGRFTVIDERVVEGKDSSKVIIRRLDGTVENLPLAQARGLIQPQDTVTVRRDHYHHGGGFGLGTILWWSTMGHMMGRGFGTSGFAQPGIYRPGYSGGSMATQELQRTAISRTSYVPAKSRSGFFRGSGRSSGAG